VKATVTPIAHRNPRLALVAALLGIALLVNTGGCGKKPSASVDQHSEPGRVDLSQPAPREPDGHQRMIELLSSINRRKDYENTYLGKGEMLALKAELDALPATAPVGLRFNTNLLLGQHELRVGLTADAIKHLAAAHQIAASLVSSTPDGAEAEQVMLYELALAYLRLAENSNCVHCQTGESCIIPIRGDGIHTDKTGAREAIDCLTQLLQRNPKDTAAKWLLNLAYMTVGGYPDEVPAEYRVKPEKFASDQPFPRFLDVAANVGLNTLSMSGGSIVDDFDQDRLLDVVVSDWDPGSQLRFFRNQGDVSFREQTEPAGLLGITGGLNMVQADYDNDGDVDILVMRGAWLEQYGQHPNSLLQNDGQGRFRDVTFEVGLGDVHRPTPTASWGDYDNDGDLDLFVGNEQAPCQLFQNDGQGSFVDVAAAAGVTNDRFTKGVIWGDYDGDRRLDLYVSNLQSENRLYHNQGDGTFQDVAPQLGVTGPLASFAVWFWDYNNDGNLDLYVASYQTSIEDVAAEFLDEPHASERACLYQGDGQGGFQEVAEAQNLVRVTQTMGANFGDLDNDGFADFYLGTGYPNYDALMPNVMYRNRGGQGFADVTTAGGFGHLQKGHGVAFADFDHDGDQDLFIELGGAYPGDAFRNALFENPGFDHHWMKIKLHGKQTNRSAIGARIKIDIDEDGGARTIYKWVNSGGSFGGNPLRQEIGLGQAERIRSLEIYWPTSDTTQRFENVAVDQFLEITEFEPAYTKRPIRAFRFQPAPTD
jgi:hypothetical protein